MTKLKRAGLVSSGGLLLWLTAFQLPIVPFPLINPSEGNYGRPCYSPNHDYYIERYTTPFRALMFDRAYANEGVAILYDKTGKELYKAVAHDVYKPSWDGSKVGFFGEWGGKLNVELPSPGGDAIGCFERAESP